METFTIHCMACDRVVGMTNPEGRKQAFRCPSCRSRMVFRKENESEYRIRYRWSNKALRLLERRGA